MAMDSTKEFGIQRRGNKLIDTYADSMDGFMYGFAMNALDTVPVNCFRRDLDALKAYGSR